MTNLSKLTENDILNIILYGIYRLTQDPRYSTLGELIYTLDKDNLYKLCSEFGGTVIKIPTLEELRNATKAFLIYQEVHEGKSFTKVCEELEVVPSERKDVLELFGILSEILEGYEND